jgi:mRNA interferase RelE/StbE
VKTIIFSNRAAKEMDALPVTARAAIEMALARYAQTGLGNVKRLQGEALWRLRVGEYRVVFDEDRVSILAVYAGRRSSQTYSRR